MQRIQLTQHKIQQKAPTKNPKSAKYFCWTLLRYFVFIFPKESPIPFKAFTQLMYEHYKHNQPICQ